MQLRRDRWIVRLFFWMAGIFDECFDTSLADRAAWRGTTLCTFCQVSFVWGPLVLLGHVALYGGTLALITAVPIRWFGLGSYATFVGLLALGIAAIVGAVVALTWWSDAREDARDRRPSEPSTPSLVWQGVAAMKRKVCPLVTFTQESAR